MSDNLKPSTLDKLNEVNAPVNELRALRARVNALRRKMAPALAVVKVRRTADDYCHRWSVATSNNELPPDPHRMIQGLALAGLRLPSFASANNFLNGCRRSNTDPDPERLRRKMAPALAVVKVRRTADDYCHRWSVATSNNELPPDPQ